MTAIAAPVLRHRIKTNFNADAEGVYDGMEFLKAFNEGTPMPLGRRVVVIGGGNVAYDVARSALRPLESFGREEALEHMGRGEQVAYDVASAAEAPDTTTVTSEPAVAAQVADGVATPSTVAWMVRVPALTSTWV